MEIVRGMGGGIVLSLTSREASKLYNLTCFFNRARVDSLVGNGTTQINADLQRMLFEQDVAPDYDEEVQP